jgi:tetratricopeptide (TPR) repeat protein
MQIIATEAEGGDTKNAGMVIKLLMRRGTASCQLGLFTDALTDYHQARVRYEQLSGAQIGQLNGVSVESLAADIVRLKLLSDAETLKKEGDALMAERDTAAALAKYTSALALIPVHVSCLSNRSACRLAMRDLDGCIADCSTAVAILSIDAGAGAGAPLSAEKGLDISAAGSVLQQEQLKTMLANILPPAGSAKRTTWLVKTLLRRGVAYTQQGAYALAVEDYAAASALDPANEALKGDLQQLIAARDKNSNAGADTAEPALAQ